MNTRPSPLFPPALLVLCALLAAGADLRGAEQSDAPPAGRSAKTLRTWTDITGKHKIRAVLLGVEDEKAQLKTAGGRVLRVPLDKLSQADRKWIEGHSGAAEEPGSPATGEAPAEWPGWLGPAHDGKSPDTGLLKQWPDGGPRLLWKTDVLGGGFSSVAVSGGTVYATGDSGDELTLYAFDLDGKQKWKSSAGPDGTRDHAGSRSTPTVDGGRVYLLSGAGRLASFDARSGKLKWTRDAQEFGGSPGHWGYAESVLILGRLAIFKPGGAKCIVALDKATGRDVWSSRGFAAGPEYGSCLPVPEDQPTMVVTGTNGGIVAVDARKGSLLWSNPFAARNTANCPTPAYGDGYVFWANGYGKGGICLQLTSSGGARQAWTTREMDCHHGGYVIDNGYIYGNHGSGWVCLDLKTGHKQWQERGVGKGSLCWADGMLYLFSENEGQAALATCSPRGLEIKGRVQVQGSGPSWAHPVVIGGRLYLRYDTNLYCFDVKAG
jgi:outer membrane protein assembly factor BamB